MKAADITIAVTVYKRDNFIFSAIESAINQRIQVKVIVVDDNPECNILSDKIISRFGNKITYFKNSKNRGLFDNWNACIENCQTSWLSILHDDDFLCPNFIESILDLANQSPNNGLYFGEIKKIYDDGSVFYPAENNSKKWIELGSNEHLSQLAKIPFLGFPGNLFKTEFVKQLGGFNRNSLFTGDWDIWYQLSLYFGGALTYDTVSAARCHNDSDRASNIIIRKGLKWVLDNIQIKKNIYKFNNQRNLKLLFKRDEIVRLSPIPSKVLLTNAAFYSQRILHYNWWLFSRSSAPSTQYLVIQTIVRFLGPLSLKYLSLILVFIKNITTHKNR